jgi:hypothetical protein
MLRKHSLDAKIALVKKNGAIYGRTVSSIPKHPWRRQSCRSKWCGWIARRPSRFTSNCIVKYEKNSSAEVLIQALPVCLPPLGKARRLMQRSRRINSAFNLENIETILIGVPFFYRWRKGRVESA